MSWLGFEILLLFVFTAIAGFFAGTEVAYTGLNLSHLKRIHKLKPGYFKLWEQRPDLVLSILLISNNAMGAAVGVLAAHQTRELSHIFLFKESLPMLFLVGLAAGTFLLIFGEMLPKIYARQFTLSWALNVTPLMNVITRVLAPAAEVSVKIINRILVFQRGKTPSPDVPLDAELKSILEHSTIPISSKKIINNLIDFSRAYVRELMTPRPQILALASNEPLNKIIQTVIQSGYSRIPVFSGSFDNIVGVLYSKDLLVSWKTGTLVLLEDLLRPVFFVEENQPMGEVMRVFRTGKHHLAIVKDNLQKGRVTGLITLQDALEALVGPIEEEL